MAKFRVTLIETLKKIVEVEASNIDEAKKFVIKNYNSETEGYILTADDFSTFEIGEVEYILPLEILSKIADWLVETGYKNTMSGNYHISFEDTANRFNLPTNVIITNAPAIASLIDSNEKILSETWIDEDFDMNFVGDFDD